MVKRFLITTALEETWPDGDVPILFLGEWCRLYARKVRWSVLDAELMPYHWDDRAKLYTDYQYLQELHERLLRDLSKRLNEIHGVNYSLRYWRILVGVWLGYFTQVLFDRWTCIQQTANKWDTLYTIVFSGNQATLVPNDINDFNRLFHDDSWNHYIYGEIIRSHTNISFTNQEINENEIADSPSDLTPTRSFIHGLIKKIILPLYLALSSSLVRSKDALIASTYIGHLNEIRLQCRLRQVPRIYRTVKTDPQTIDSARRQWSLEGQSRTMFEAFVRDMIPKQIPMLYLEGYESLTRLADNQTWPKCPKIIWTSNIFSSDEVFKAAAAKMTEAGTPLIIGQHGGHYGIGRWNFSEEHELSISDVYLSWGWKDPNNGHIEPIGKLKSRSFSKRDRNVPYRATLVTAALQRYSGSMMSSFMSSQYLDYLQDQFIFVANLPKTIKQNLIVRLYPHDAGWSQAERWRENCGEIELDSGRLDIGTLMAESRIYISTYNATTYLESLSMGVPTIMFWNPNHWELRDTAIPYFEKLKAVGIFHESPVSAARHCAAIWDDVEAWWQSVEVQSAIQEFCQQYARCPVNLLDEIEIVVRNTLSENRKCKPEATLI